MKERPILFSAAMVRALLDGRKMQTRRVIVVDRVFSVLRPFYDGRFDDRGNFHYRVRQNMDGMIGLRDPHIAEQWCPHGQPGDRLWVREAWRTVAEADSLPPRSLNVAHRIWREVDAPHQPGFGKYRPPMFMPRWVSRVLLEITNVRVERLQDISNDDALAEGINRPIDARYPVDEFRALWDSINAARGFGWDVNPWVWVVEFRRIS